MSGYSNIVIINYFVYIVAHYVITVFEKPFSRLAKLSLK